VAEIPKAAGAIVEVEGQKLAVYRDGGGRLHALSPVCTHMGCIVRWNAAERSWDCPCHGGRFSALGDVQSGPPMRDLEGRSLPRDAP
jgi:Rieske Fe-S protein